MNQAEILNAVADLRWSNPHFSQWYKAQSAVSLSNPETHHLIPADIRGIAEFKAQLAPLTDALRGLVSKNKQADLTRSTCFKYLAYAKKWLGFAMPPNLSKLSLAALRQRVSECYPDKLPKLVPVTYEGVMTILRGLRKAGHKVTLRAKLPKLLAQVTALVKDWENNYKHLVEIVRVHEETAKLQYRLFLYDVQDWVVATPDPRKGHIVEVPTFERAVA